VAAAAVHLPVSIEILFEILNPGALEYIYTSKRAPFTFAKGSEGFL
jgi:hypothetical protein